MSRPYDMQTTKGGAMRTILVMNPKGGCGKSTVSMNLATYYADEGAAVTIADYDPQRSCLDWLEARKNYDGIPDITGVAAFRAKPRISMKSDVVIMDVPARTHGAEMTTLLKNADTLLMPVLPSPIDMRAAAKYLEEIKAKGHVSSGKTRIGLLANRVRENTNIYRELAGFLEELPAPLVAALRDSQNYVRAAATGLGIFEMAPSSTRQDIDTWIPLLDWLDSKASQPAA